MKTFGLNQNYVYDEFGSKEFFIKDDLDITFESSKSIISFNNKSGQPYVPSVSKVAVAPALLSLFPTIVDIGFRLTNSMLENNVKKFTAEYTKHKSNLDAGNGKVPDFSIIRNITIDDLLGKKAALEISFKAIEVVGIKGFYYYVERLRLTRSSAKSTKKYKTFDYSIELKPTFLIDGAKKVQELAPIVISSVGFGNNDYDNITPKYKHRTDIIPLSDGAALTEISIKIIETNQAKVSAEKILSIWNNNKESAKTIINNFLPKKKENKSIPKQLIFAKNEKFISVLISDLNLSWWSAIQWADSLSAIQANPYYEIGNTEDFPKNSNDKILDKKTVKEKTTNAEGTAIIIELS